MVHRRRFRKRSLAALALMPLRAPDRCESLGAVDRTAERRLLEAEAEQHSAHAHGHDTVRESKSAQKSLRLVAECALSGLGRPLEHGDRRTQVVPDAAARDVERVRCAVGFEAVGV